MICCLVVTSRVYIVIYGFPQNQTRVTSIVVDITNILTCKVINSVIDNLRGRYHTISGYDVYNNKMWNRHNIRPTSHHDELPLYGRKENNFLVGGNVKTKI